MKSFIIVLYMDENFHSLLVDGEVLHRERDKGRANQKLENVFTEVMRMSLHLDRPAVDKLKT
jgi:hypothetical protein